jgi:hypothetical protein
MARKPNYNFERQERDRAKAEKLAAKAKAKSELKANGETDGAEDQSVVEDDDDGAETDPAV